MAIHKTRYRPPVYVNGEATYPDIVYFETSADMVKVTDEDELYDATDVEAALAEVKTELDEHKSAYASQMPLKADNTRVDAIESLVNNVIDGELQAVLNSEVVATDIANKLNAKEAEYAPRLTTAEQQINSLGEIIQAVVDVMGGAIIGYVDENNVIVLVGGLEGETYTVKYKMEDESLIDIGELDLVEKHSVTNNLTNCTNSNDSTEVVTGDSYTATITAGEGYNLSSLIVTMGGVDITSSVVSGGNISIASVTGNIVITAVAEEEEEVTNYFDISTAQLNFRIGSGDTPSAYNGIVLTDYIPIDPTMLGKSFVLKGVTPVMNTAYNYTARIVYYTSSKVRHKPVNYTESVEYAAWLSDLEDESGFIRISVVIKDNVAITSADVEDVVINLE